MKEKFTGNKLPPESTKENVDTNHSITKNNRPTSIPDSGKNDILLRFNHVQKTYDGEILVVKDLTLDVVRGEFLTLLGPSGSGKTTCLMMVAGFEVPTHGEIFLEGRPINKVPPYKREIGIVFQNYALFPHMTVEDNLAYPLRVRKIAKKEIEKHVASALEMVQLGGFNKRYTGQLSGGQQQRIALARALIFKPRLVLMDEPLGALDKQLRKQMQFEIKHIHENIGVTMIYVTHDQSEALTLSSRIAVFEDGVIQQLATPEDLYEYPQNAFVAQFIGENNRMLGRVKSIEGKECTVKLDKGEEVKALAVNVQSAGELSTLSIRPERVIIEPEPGTCPNIFEAQVEELTYLGDHFRVRLNFAGNNNFIVKVNNSADCARLKKEGTTRVGWHLKDCRALDAS